jgi:uncharacterized Zn-binding protein involved in type VI secretion
MTQNRKLTVLPAEPTVLIEGQPAVIAGHSADNAPLMISGEPTILVGGHPVAILDGQMPDCQTSSEHPQVFGKPTVLIAGRPARSSQ